MPNKCLICQKSITVKWSQWQKYCLDCMNQNHMKGGNTMTEIKKTEGVAEVPKTKIPKKFGSETDEKVIALFKEGKKFSEISKAMGGSPAIPKIKRTLTKAGLLK